MGLIEELKKKRDQAVALARKVPASPVSAVASVARKTLPNTSFNNPGSVAYGVANKVTPMAVRDVFDSNTKADQIRRVKGEERKVNYNPLAFGKSIGQNKKTYTPTPTPYRIPTSYEDEQKMKGNNRPFTNLGQQVVGNSARVLNTVKQQNLRTVPQALAGATLMVANRTGRLSNRDYNNAVNNVLSDKRVYGGYRDKGGVLNAGTVIDSPEQAKNLTTKDVVQKSVGYGMGTYGELSPIGAKGGFAGRTLLGATEGAIGDAGSQLVNTGRIDPRQTLGSALFGGALSNAGPVASKLLGRNTPTPRTPDPRLNDADVSGLLKIKNGRGDFMDDVEYTKALESVRKAGIDITKPEAWSQIDGVLARYNQVLEGRGDPSMFDMGQSRFKPTPLNQSGFSSPDSPLTPVNRIGKMLGAKDPLESLKQEARKYGSAEEFVAGVQKQIENPASGKSFTALAKEYGLPANEQKLLNDVESLRWTKDNGINTYPEAARQLGVEKAYADITAKISREGDTRYKNPYGNVGMMDETYTRQNLTDLYNQATQSQPPKSPLANDAPQVGKTPTFERDLNTGKMKMVSEPKPPVKTEKYSIANSDISRTKSPGMNQDGFTVEDWGGKKRYVSLDDASAETRKRVRKAEAEYEAAKKANNGTALSAKQKVNDAYSDAIDDLKLQDYATTENGGRTFNSKYNDWLETKYKDRNVDSATIKDMATNPQKYRSQFEAETTPVAQVGKTPKTVETPVSPPAPKASNDLNAQRVFKNKETVLETIRQDKAVTKAAVDAQRTGQEVNFVATYDQNGRSVGVKPYEPSSMSIESGFVVNQQGQVIGTHIKVDDTGISANVGGEIVNMTDVVGNPSQWGNSYEVSSTMDRNLQKNAPDDATYRKTRSFVIDNKTKNEANLKTELKAKRQELSTRVADIQSVKPKNVSDTEFKSDIFDAIEGKMDDVELGRRYSPEVVAKINDYKAQTRQVYDELLDRVNTVFRRYGQPEVPHRADYLTHINELNNKPNFAGEMFGELQNSLLGEGMTRTRGQVPGNIAGRTENFEPTRKWNKFFQQRKGGKFDKDPFKAVDTYLEPTLYNIHMTESAVRARAIEATFRAVDEIKQMDSKAFSDTLNESLEQFRGGNSPKLISGFQEYANALAGKTQRWDRQVIDSSRAGELGLKGWQGLQRIGGRATVLGNANSVLSQALGTPMALAQAGPKNYIKGIVRAVKGDKIIDQSPFITARRTNSDSIFKTKFDKTMDVGGVPLQKMELAFVENTWHGMHEKALSQGYTGRQAILEADRLTERVVAGRGIADKPEAYRSTISNGFLQYTLEVNAQNKAFWRDLDTKQKATFIVSAYLMNEAYGFVTGNEPLPDFLGATIDSVQDFRNKEDERNTKDKLIGSGRRYVGEVAEMNPFVQAGANTVLTQDQRKKVFGEDSSLGRFDGVAAPVQVVRNTASAVGNLLEGDFKGARNDALKVTPFGNQAKKTVTGAETISKGYAVDSSGNPTFSAPTSFAGKAQTLIFGPNSSKRAGSYYDSDQRALSKDQAEQLRDLPKEKQAGFLESIQNKRMDNRKKEKDGTSTSVLTPTLQDIKDNQEAKTENFKSQFSDDDYELLGNEDMRKEAIAKGIKTQEELDGLDRYALNKRKELGMPAGQLGAKEVPERIDKTDDKVKSFYTDRSYVHQDDYEAWQSSVPESESAKDMIRRVNQMRPEGLPELPANNRTAELYADYKKEQANSKWSKLQETEKKKELLRTVYKTQLTDDQKFVDELGTEKLIYAIDNGQVDPNVMKSMVELDNALIKLGGTAMLSKTVRSRYGLGSAPSSGGGSGSGKAKKPVGLGSFTLLPQKSSIGSVANLLKNARVSYKS